MSQNKIDRRTFLKIMGTAGASAAAISMVSPAAAFYDKPRNVSSAPLAVEQKPWNDFAKLPKDKLTTLYTRMVRSRKWETAMKDAFVAGNDGLYGAFHPFVGEEAAACGLCAALNNDDYITSTHRGHGDLIAKGGDLNKMAAEIFLRVDGYNKGTGGSMHMTDSSLGILGMNGIVGAAWFIAAGAAYSAKVRGTKQVSVGMAGDGASNSVYYFSAMRNAVNYNLPYIAVVYNNRYQISIPYESNIVSGHSSSYTKGLPISSVTIDGNDVAQVYQAANDAVVKARAGGGPSMIEMMTYRWYDHAGFAGAKVGVDGAFGLAYRPDSEVKYWMQFDPIKKARDFLVEQKLFTDAELTKIETDVQTAVTASLDFARKSAHVKPQDGLLNVYDKLAVSPTQFLDSVVPTTWKEKTEDYAIYGKHIPFDL